MTKRSKLSIILSGLSIVGVGITGFLSAKCTEDYLEVDDPDRIIFAKTYAPAIIAGLTTCGCIIGAEKINLTDIAILGTALTGLRLKYNDAMDYLKREYPEIYGDVKRYVDTHEAMRKIKAIPESTIRDQTENPDGTFNYYFPWTEQLLAMDPDDMVKVQHFIDARIGTEMSVCVNEILDYIHRLGYTDVRFADQENNDTFEFDADEWIDEDSFPELNWNYFDVPDPRNFSTGKIVARSLFISRKGENEYFDYLDEEHKKDRYICKWFEKNNLPYYKAKA